MILDFFHRKARPFTMMGFVILVVSLAGTIGWMTAPV